MSFRNFVVLVKHEILLIDEIFITCTYSRFQIIDFSSFDSSLFR